MEIVRQAQEIKIKMVEQPDALDILGHFMLFTDLYHFTEMDHRSSTPVQYRFWDMFCFMITELFYVQLVLIHAEGQWVAKQILGQCMLHWPVSCRAGRSSAAPLQVATDCNTDLGATMHRMLHWPVSCRAGLSSKGQQTAIQILRQQCIACFTDLYHVELGYPVRGNRLQYRLCGNNASHASLTCIM